MVLCPFLSEFRDPCFVKTPRSHTRLRLFPPIHVSVGIKPPALRCECLLEAQGKSARSHRS